jgi:hypothetical protein
MLIFLIFQEFFVDAGGAVLFKHHEFLSDQLVSSLLLFTRLFLGAVTSTSNMKLIIVNSFCNCNASFLLI